MSTSKASWEQVKHEWVTGGDEVTFKALAAQHGLAADTVARRAKRDGWRDQRSGYRLDTSRLAQQKTREAVADGLAERNALLGEDFFTLAQASLKAALDAEGGRERQSQTLAAATATDKWRLLTGQTTAKPEGYKPPEYTPEELAEHVAEVRKILATAPEQSTP